MGSAGTIINSEVAAVGISSSRASELLVEVMGAHGYQVNAVGTGQYQLARTYRAAWVVPCAVVGALFFGLGLLLLLLAKKSETCIATVGENQNGVSVRLVGTLRPVDVDRLTAAFANARVRSDDSPPGRAAPMTSTDSSPTTPGRVAPAPAILPMPGSNDHRAGGDPVEDVDSTVMRGSLPSSGLGRSARRNGLEIRLADRSSPIGVGLVVGRNPSGDGGVPGAASLAVADVSLSKTHAVLRATLSGVDVRDLSSTNGSRIRCADGRSIECPPGEWISVPQGAVLLFGDVLAELVST